MTKIKNYPLDLDINGSDKWIGTDSASLAKLTKNFTPDNLAKYYNDKEVVESVNQLRFFYDTVDPGDDRASGSFSFPTEVGPIVSFSSISNLVFSKYTMGNDAVNNFMTDIVNSIIIIQKADNPNIYAFYALNSYEVDPLNGDFYNVSITYSSGTGSVEEDEDYLVSLIQFAGAAGIQTILGSEFIDSSLTGIGEVTLSLSATGTPSNLTGLRGDNTWGTLGLEGLDEGGRNSYLSTDPPIGWRIIGRDPSLYGNIGEDAIDFSTGYFQNETLPFGGSITNSPQIGSTGPGSFTLGNTVENNSSGGVVFGSANVLNGGPNIEPTYFVGGVILGQYNQSYGLNYYNFTSGYKNLIGDRTQQSWTDAGFPSSWPIQYWSGQIGMYNQMPSGYASVQLGYGLLSGGPFCTTVGLANEDVTLTIAKNIVNDRNALNPRFIVGCGTFAGNTSNPSVGVRQNGFVVMSDGTATFPILSNAMIDAAGDDSAVTKGWVNAQGTGTPTGLEAIDEGNGTGWRLIGRDAANYGDLGAGAIDFSDSNTISTVNGSTGVGAVTFGYNSKNPLKYSIVSGFEQNISITSDLYADGIGNLIAGESNTIYNNNWNNIVSGYLNTVGTEGAVLTSLGPVVYDSIIQGTRNEVYASRDSLYVGRGLIGGSRGVTVVGYSNVDLTTSTSNYAEAGINDYGPRFIVGVGTWSGTSSGGSAGTRANGFVVMSDGTATFPSLTNVMIDAADDDSAVTKGWVLAQTDVNTTYDLASAQNGADVDVTLTGSDTTVDTVKLVAGNGITLTDDGSNNVTIDANTTATQANFVFYTVKNSSGSQILKGKGVMAVGTDGNSGHILIDEMVADGSVEPRYYMGVLESTLDNGEIGRVIHFGELDQFNTNGQNGETWNDGDVLWCDPANPGDFTIVEPDGPNVKIASAIVINQATNGKIKVRVQGNEGIHELHDTRITTQADGELLVWNNTDGVWFNDGTATIDYTNGRVGIGTTTPGQKLDIAGDAVLSTGGAIYGDTTNPYIRLNNTGGAVLGYGTSQLINGGSLQFQSTGGVKFRVNSAGGGYIVGNFGFGTTSPSSALHVYGATRIDQSADWDGLNIYGFDDQAADYIKIHIGTTPMARYQSNLTHSFYVGNSRNLDIYATSVGFSVDSTRSDDLVSIFGTNKDSYLGYSNTDDKFKIGFGSLSTPTVDSNTQLSLDGSGVYVENNLGVGTATPAAKLDVNGGIRMADDATAASALNVGTLRYRSDANNSYVDMSMQTGASTYAWVNIVQNNW